jgi:hypothetical protein
MPPWEPRPLGGESSELPRALRGRARSRQPIVKKWRQHGLIPVSGSVPFTNLRLSLKWALCARPRCNS